MAARRDISPFLQRIRAFLLGREHITAHRFEDSVASRSPPPPNIPGGPAHILSANYYHQRDARRLVAPPIDVVQLKLLNSKEDAKPAKAEGKIAKLVGKLTKGDGKSAKGGAQIPIAPKLPTPGQVYHWD